MAFTKDKTKIEQFIQALLLAGREGLEPRLLGGIIKTNVINSYAQKLRTFNVVVKTSPVYSLASDCDARIALKRLNNYRCKRGAQPMSNDCLLGWD